MMAATTSSVRSSESNTALGSWARSSATE
jgi:hypothetical protein